MRQPLSRIPHKLQDHLTNWWTLAPPFFNQLLELIRTNGKTQQHRVLYGKVWSPCSPRQLSQLESLLLSCACQSAKTAGPAQRMENWRTIFLPSPFMNQNLIHMQKLRHQSFSFVLHQYWVMMNQRLERRSQVALPPGRGCRPEVYHGKKPLGFLRVSFRVLLVLPQFWRDFTFQAYLRCHVRCRF